VEWWKYWRWMHTPGWTTPIFLGEASNKNFVKE
jgi:hypothetical protein